MRWMLIFATTAIAMTLWLPGEAAEPAGAEPASVQRGDAISFEQYRDWRNDFIERRRSELAAELAAADLPERRQDRLRQIKAYYDWYAGLPGDDRDRRFRERFDRIDTNHDGTIDPVERAAWHDKRRVLYRRAGDTPHQPSAAEAHR